MDRNFKWELHNLLNVDMGVFVPITLRWLWFPTLPHSKLSFGLAPQKGAKPKFSGCILYY